MEKKCKRCGEQKALSEFYRRARNKVDGHDNKCKECREAVSAEFDAKHPERVAMRAKTSQHDKAYAARNPEKRRAKEKVKDAIRRGDLIPQPCEVCGKTKGYIDGHHDDYSKPLSVRWLCRKHHKEHHANLNAVAK